MKMLVELQHQHRPAQKVKVIGKDRESIEQQLTQLLQMQGDPGCKMQVLQCEDEPVSSGNTI